MVKTAKTYSLALGANTINTGYCAILILHKMIQYIISLAQEHFSLSHTISTGVYQSFFANGTGY